MDRFERRLEADLKDLAEHDDHAASKQKVLDIILNDEPATRRTYQRPATAALAGAAAVLVAIGALSATGVLGGSDASSTSARDADSGARPRGNGFDGPAGLVGPGEPCPGAVHGSLSQVALKARVPIWTPAAAVGERLTDGWTCGDTPVLMFNGDLQVSYEAGWANVDVEEKFAALAKDYGGTVGTVVGRPALIQAASETGGNNQVLVVVGDTLIRVLATDGVPIDRLVSLADALQIKTAD